MWTRKKLMRVFPDVLVDIDANGGSGPMIAHLYEATASTTTLYMLSGTRLWEAVVPSLDLVRALNQGHPLFVEHWTQL